MAPKRSKANVALPARAAEAKVSPATMARADQIAKRPDLEKKVVAGEMKPAEALREIRSTKRRQELEEAVAKAAAERHESDRPKWSILNVDVMDGLESVRDEHGPARLIFTDPPYNIGIDYGDGEQADRLSDASYMKWVRQWFALCWDCLTDDGSLWVMIGDEYAAEYAVELKSTGFTIRSWVKWYETFGVNCSNKFNRTSRHIFYAVKDEHRFVFDPEPVTRPSDRQTKYGDRRAASGGKLWDDVWQIPRLTGTCAERIPDSSGDFFPTQLPLALVEPIVLCASMPGDLVVDPFNGSGTTGVAAVRNGRKYIGIEKSEAFADIADKRITCC
jgi:site-specific DNA-methyltransferase (adenine-specific)